MAGFEPASSLAPKASGVTGLPNIPRCFFMWTVWESNPPLFPCKGKTPSLGT